MLPLLEALFVLLEMVLALRMLALKLARAKCRGMWVLLWKMLLV